MKNPLDRFQLASADVKPRLIWAGWSVPHGTNYGYCKHACRCVRCKAAHSEYGRRWRAKYPTHAKHHQLRSDFKISYDDYVSMQAHQNGVCAICGRGPIVRRLAVDHCHKTGRIRGLLCGRCNGPLGWYEQHAQQIRGYLDEQRPAGSFSASVVGS